MNTGEFDVVYSVTVSFVVSAAEAEAAGLAAETLIAGDPTFAGPLSGVALNLEVWHIIEVKENGWIDLNVYDEEAGINEEVIEYDDIIAEMNAVRDTYYNP